MSEGRNRSKDQGGSDNPVRPKNVEPGNDNLPERDFEEDKVIGIGMPISKEELERLKEKAKKKDH